MLRSLARLFLIAAFLVAQSAGLAHQTWHDVSSLSADTGSHALDGKAPKKNLLCDFHAALGTVLGAVSCGGSSAHAAAAAEVPFIAAEVSAARFSLLASRSRGPPAFL